MFDSLAICVDGKRAWDTTASIRWHFTDTGETYIAGLTDQPDPALPIVTP
ncbi:MAG: alkyl sulfatase C-terminal domain-containing protein [Isosphaeraceae bacterium]